MYVSYYHNVEMYSGIPSDPCVEVQNWKHPFTCIVGGPSGS